MTDQPDAPRADQARAGEPQADAAEGGPAGVPGEQVATFAAGCFWGVEERFAQVPGVRRTRVGYTGGHADQPTYEQVCSGATGHAEAVEVGFDPDRVGYDELLEVFWAVHDPTQVDRQGADVGTQYRSAIFCHDADQRRAAEDSRDRLAASGRPARPIATTITEASTFWPAEDYHQRYLARLRGTLHRSG